MKRVATIISTAFLTVLVTAGTALAQEYPPSVAGGGGGNQGGVSGAGGGGGETAFTGGDVSLAAIAFAVLLVVGVTALVVSRRRAARVTA